MHKSNRLSLTIACITTTLALTACGGGGGNGFSPGASKEQIAGDWITGCITYTNGTSEFQTASFTKLDDGSDAVFIGNGSYTNDNCSGESEVLVLGGPVRYTGTVSTPSCTALKFDATIKFITDGNTSLAGDQAQQFLASNNLPGQIFDLACKVNNYVLMGDDSGNNDGYSDSTRPTRMEERIHFNVWNRQARQAKNITPSMQDGLKQITKRLEALK